MDRRTFLRGAAGGAGALAMGACGQGLNTKRSEQDPLGTPRKTGADPKQGTLRLAGGDFGFPSPFTYRLGPGYVQMIYIYDTLLLQDSARQIVPWLAASYSRSADGLVYVFDLRDGVRWHDGKPFNAADVVFSFDYFASQSKAGKLPPQLITSAPELASVLALGDRRVEFRLRTPEVTFPENVAARFPIFPSHIWSGVPDASKVQDSKMLVGTGPYRLDSYTRGEGSYSYTANDDFFLGKPVMRRLEMVAVDNPLTALLSQDLDVASPTLGAARENTLRKFRG